jgi:hypothetical protein
MGQPTEVKYTGVFFAGNINIRQLKLVGVEILDNFKY